MKREKEWWDIRDRSLEYGVRVVRLYRALAQKKDGAALIVGKQFLRAATSIGANLAEAQAAESTADFIHKYSIAQKEVRECGFWLDLLEKAEMLPPNRLADLRQETDELTAVITAIIVKKKRHQKSS